MSSPGNPGGQTPGERAIIERIRSRLPEPPPSLIVGVGDDAAVVAPERGALQVLTTDALVEGIHFDRRFSSVADVGYKAIAVNASDIAAMGATPSYALLSLILPDGTSLADLDGLLDGVLEMATSAQLAVIGGNVSRSPGPLVVDVTVAGHVRPRRILTRSGGRPGDVLFVTGTIGAATAGLRCLQARRGVRGAMADCVLRHRRPEPRLRIGALLGRTRTATACIDLSDGLADAVRHIAESSGTGAVINAEALPVDAAAAAWFSEQRQDAIAEALSGGDDYELLFSVPSKSMGRFKALTHQTRGVPLTRIGELTADSAVSLMRDGAPHPLPSGFTHF